jgi:hypothetical protein
MMKVSFHNFRELSDEIMQFWRETNRAQHGAAVLTNSPDWFELMAGEDPAQSSVAVVRDDPGSLRAVIPLLVRTWELAFGIGSKRLAGRRLRVMKASGGDLLEASLRPEDLAVVWRSVMERFPDTDAIWFDHISDEGRRNLVLESCSSGSGVLVHLPFRQLPHYSLVMPADEAACLGLRSARSLQRIRTKERALGRELENECQVVEIRERADWLPLAGKIEHLMNHSWQAQLSGQQFRMDNFAGIAERGWLRAFLLMCGDRAVAFTVYYQGMGNLVSGVLGYDRAFARFSPGAILFYRMLAKLYEHDTPLLLDFGEGDAEYKRQWANRVTEVGSVLVVRQQPFLVTLFALHRVWSGVTEASRWLLKRLGIERCLARRIKRAA